MRTVICSKKSLKSIKTAWVGGKKVSHHEITVQNLIFSDTDTLLAS